jgi:hypothetical protein
MCMHNVVFLSLMPNLAFVLKIFPVKNNLNRFKLEDHVEYVYQWNSYRE